MTRRNIALAIAMIGTGLATPAPAQTALVGPAETLHAAGTEPFWGAEVRRGRLVLKTPDNERGEAVRVRRAVARGRVTYAGVGREGRMTVVVTRARCSDGMSERDYPLTVTIKYARGGALAGCGWTARRPFRGEG